jgi:Fic family protein
MPWNWEFSNWPNFTWQPDILQHAEELFMQQSGIIIGARSHLDEDDETELKIQLLSTEALDTSQIEGESLDRDSIQASIRRHLGLSAERNSGARETGIAKMMVDLYQHIQSPLAEDALLNWHIMAMNGRWDLNAIGRYRTHDDPMEIVSNRLGGRHVHFVAMPTHDVPDGMKRFMDWLHDSAPDGTKPLPAITRAGIAHVWFLAVHPFEDGNGRIGRAVVEKTLAQSAQQPIFTGISSAIHRRRKAYYEALGSTNRTLDLTQWLRWFGTVTLDAQKRTLASVSFTIQKGRLLAAFDATMNARQRKAVLRVCAEGIDGFKGGLSADNYRRITQAPISTATRDLAGLVEMGVLRRTGERKGTRYHLNVELPDFVQSEIEQQKSDSSENSFDP